MPLPEVKVVTPERVRTSSGITQTPIDDPDLVEVCEAVDDFVRGLESVRLFVEADPALAEWPYRYRAGARMLAARLFRRKNSPEGVASFTGEGVIYVRRTDPDVAELLRLNMPVLG